MGLFLRERGKKKRQGRKACSRACSAPPIQGTIHVDGVHGLPARVAWPPAEPELRAYRQQLLYYPPQKNGGLALTGVLLISDGYSWFDSLVVVSKAVIFETQFVHNEVINTVFPFRENLTGGS